MSRRAPALRPLAGVRLSRGELEAQNIVIRQVENHLGLDIGRNDREYLATVLCNDDMELVSNDAASLGAVASAFDITLRCAEDIVVAALNEGVTTRKCVEAAIDHWQAVREWPSRKGKLVLKKAGLSV